MAKGNSRAASPNAKLLTEIVLLVFRVNGRLLSSGDRLVRELGLTSARWQMLGAVALSDRPGTAPQLAARMGMTRQAAQKQLDLLIDDGLVAAEPNPGHARSPSVRAHQKRDLRLRRNRASTDCLGESNVRQPCDPRSRDHQAIARRLEQSSEPVVKENVMKFEEMDPTTPLAKQLEDPYGDRSC